MNTIHVIHPYKSGGTLVFDDPAVDLVREALIGHTDAILYLAAKAAGANPDRFTLVFAAGPFPGRQVVARHLEKGEAGYGDWYRVELPGGLGTHDGWLCPALLKYFAEAPPEIHFQIKPFTKE